MVSIEGYVGKVMNCLESTMYFFYILMLFIIAVLFVLGILEVRMCRCKNN
jgi:hypothetical protein